MCVRESEEEMYCFTVRVTVAKEIALRIHQLMPCWRGFVSGVKVRV